MTVHALEIGEIGQQVTNNAPGTLRSFSVFFGLDSPVGPVYLAWGHAAAGNGAFYFFLGRP